MILYLNTLPAAPDAADTAASATNSCSLPEPGAGTTTTWSAPASVTKIPIEFPVSPGVRATHENCWMLLQCLSRSLVNS
ncbi:MAG: hypothetical protein CM15mV11_0950 [Caudoviricetes sp.]|nr:MAG: hypothetical protein CM15mV11_0950 [Caudoviricetes sp.]